MLVLPAVRLFVMAAPIDALPALPTRITDVERTVTLLKKLSRGGSPHFFAESMLAALAYLTPDERREVSAAAKKMELSSKTPWAPVAYLLIGLIDPAANRMSAVANFIFNLPNLFMGHDGRSILDGLGHRIKTMGKAAPEEGLDAMFVMRVQEVAAWIDADESHKLLAYPDEPSGHVDPYRVLDDLTNLTMRGIAAGSADLQQTVLRFPTDMWPYELVDDFASLGSPDATWVSTAIAAGPIPPPQMTLYSTVLHKKPSLVTRAEWPGIEVWDWPLLQAARSLPQVRDALYDTRASDWMMVRAQALPSQRELVAAHMVRTLVSENAPHNVQRLLPHLQGPIGPSVLLSLAYGGSASAKLRHETLLALRIFANNGQVNGRSLGQAMASVANDNRLIKLGRWAHLLDDLAKVGATEAIFAWQIMAALLDGDVDLTMADRSGYTHLLEVARLIVRRCRARGELETLDRLIAKRPKSRSGILAFELQKVLSSPLTAAEQQEWAASRPPSDVQDQPRTDR